MNTTFLNLFFFSPSICSFLEDNCFTTLCGFCHTAFLFLKLTGIAPILSHGLFVFVSQAFARPFTLLRVSGAESLQATLTWSLAVSSAGSQHSRRSACGARGHRLFPAGRCGCGWQWQFCSRGSATHGSVSLSQRLCFFQQF